MAVGVWCLKSWPAVYPWKTLVIIKKEGESVYQLWLPKTQKRISLVFNEIFLSPFTSAQYPSKKPPNPTPSITVESFEEYKTNVLMDSKFPWGKWHYLIKWKDYPNYTDWTWASKGEILPDNKVDSIKYTPVHHNKSQLNRGSNQYHNPKGKLIYKSKLG